MLRRISSFQAHEIMNAKKTTNRTELQRQHPKKHVNSRSNSTDSPQVWPSDHHKVVTFFCKSKHAVDLAKHVASFGTVKQSMLLTKKTVFLNRIEMSTSAEARSVWEYFRNNLLDGVVDVKPDLHKTLPRKTKIYEDFWTKSEVEKGLEKGEVVMGNLRVNKKNFNFAFVADKEGKDIVIRDLKGRNRALTGDLVAVKINDESQWLSGRDESVSDLSDGVEALNLSPANQSSSSNSSSSGSASFKTSRKTGKVVAILEYNHNRMATGQIIKKDGEFSNFKPVTNGMPYLRINNQEIAEKITKTDTSKVLFTAKIKRWSGNSMFPEGELVECIGAAGEVEAETTSILVDHDIDFQDFNPSVTECLPQNLPWTIPKEERSKRRDFTEECIFSIDPSSAKDLDDALHCKKLSDDRYEVGVHIADVSYFVTPNTALDRVASSRCTTVYLVQKAIPMLPSMLCEDLCSLNPGVERLAFSVVWNIDERGKIYSQWFGRSVIRSCAKFSYDHAQSLIDRPERDFDSPEGQAAEGEFPSVSGGFAMNALKSKVLQLHRIAQNLRRQRIDSGALKLDQVRLAYALDSESGLPNGCYKYSYKKSNELIEEFMLLANISVAHKIYKHLRGQAFLRCHPEPKQDMMDDVVSHCNEIGLPIDATSSQSLARSLDEAAGHDDLADCRKQALFMLAIKPQQLALYFCAGAIEDEERYRHYALNVPLYTHFTSPIRRYADVIVHRQLAHVLGDTRHSDIMETDSEVLQKQAQRCNDKKMNSKAAQEQSIELFFTILVNNFGPLECRGMVMYVHDHSFDVLSIEYGVVKRVYADALPLLSFKTDQTKRTGRELKVNVLKLKWPTGDLRGRRNVGIRPPNYEECGEGVEQTIDVFDIVDLVLYKSEPHSVRKYNASIKRPDPNSDAAQEAKP